jgi:uncharacterized damage-inducible protein DinB
MSAALVELFRHNLWANQRLLALCAGLGDELLDASAPGTYGRVRDTLVHILANEEGYVTQSGGTLPEPSLFQLARDGTVPGFDELRARAQRSGEGLIALAGRVRPEDTLRLDWQGQSYELPAVVPLIQAINHATEHRAHVVTIITQHGVETPQLDAWAFWRAGMGRTPAAAPPSNPPGRRPRRPRRGASPPSTPRRPPPS